ncbi:hypothetical protein [Stappia indica]|uniref:hypothetical protein n=1 Tax=Stappia indica TaxID=538381 RepID=UPI001CD4F86A|nr:hypothetical protein [Stappia indica]MCA1298875.1 hypothetical protein [Stappia indica]
MAGIAAALIVAGCVSDGGSERSWEPDVPKPSREELICLASNLTPGTQEFNQCLAMVKVSEMTEEDYRKERERRETIGDGLAEEICDGFARDRMGYPVKRKVFKEVRGDYEKTVKITYEIDRTQENPQVILAYRNGICTLRGSKVVDFKTN